MAMLPWWGRTTPHISYQKDSVPTEKKGLQCKFGWVKGHQDASILNKNLSRIKKLNIQMDKDAAIRVYDLKYKWMGCVHVLVLPSGEKWAVYIGDKKVMTDLQKHILNRFYEDDLIEYVRGRHLLSNNTFQQINWDGILRGLSKFTDHKREAAIKLIH